MSFNIHGLIFSQDITKVFKLRRAICKTRTMDYSSFILFSRYVLELLQLRLLNFSALYLSISKYSTKHNKVDDVDIELVASELISLHFFFL